VERGDGGGRSGGILQVAMVVPKVTASSGQRGKKRRQ
jgi:hypothetical protein